MATDSSLPILVLEPEPLPDPVITDAAMRDCQVMDEQGNVRWVRCIMSLQTSTAYCFVR